jgi:hypothetical protein
LRRKHLNAAANAKILIDAVLLQRFELLDALVQAVRMHKQAEQ